MKRILALDGGGIRGVFSLKILQRMQELLRASYGNPDLVLADHFDFFAGTSTGAIIATCLCWGKTVEEILNLYKDHGPTMFTPAPWYSPKRYLVAKYDPRPLAAFLQGLFSEVKDGQLVPALLSSPQLRKKLLVVVRNHTTESAWPLTNNPDALYAGSNLPIPLWKIVRASTAAPVYFEPEEITIDGHKFLFEDGSITPYNNPAAIAALTAVLPCYNMNWQRGADQIRIVSLGTMRFTSRLSKKVERLWLGYYAKKVPAALINGVAWQQDYLCRCLGQCLYGDTLDSEIGDLLEVKLSNDPWFSYVRYNRTYKAQELDDLLTRNPELATLDAVPAIPLLEQVGEAYAKEHVKLEHLV
jgi:patatin-like phospholipase/acyl hydrolase